MSRADDIRKRIAKRKRMRERNMTREQRSVYVVQDEEYGLKYPSYEVDNDEEFHPLFNKELFLFKVLASLCLFLIVAIIFKNNIAAFEPVKGFVIKTMETEFQFAAISDWYEKQFGKPLAILPVPQSDSTESVEGLEYALPASARILEDFREDGQKITIETAKGAPVSAMNGGRVRYIGEEEGFGQTVIIQHSDKSETWYGNLDSIHVSLYEYIEKGAQIGSAASSNDETKGLFYFAIKKGDDFVDPIQVIQFE